MHPLVEKHGKKLMDELLDMIIIRQGNISMGQALVFAHKHRIVGVATKYANLYINARTDRWSSTHPRDYFLVTLRNGRGQNKLSLTIYKDEIDQIREDLK